MTLQNAQQGHSTRCICTYHLWYASSYPVFFNQVSTALKKKDVFFFFVSEITDFKTMLCTKMELVSFHWWNTSSVPQTWLSASVQGASPWQGWSQRWTISRQTRISLLFVVWCGCRHKTFRDLVGIFLEKNILKWSYSSDSWADNSLQKVNTVNNCRSLQTLQDKKNKYFLPLKCNLFY